MHRPRFPFSAVIGQQDAKDALLCGLVNPRIGGVLLCGQKGCAKSTLVRAMANLSQDVNVIELPLNATEDMVVGTVDMERAIKNGERAYSGGVLARAHGHVLYVDEVNLLSDSIVNCLLDVAQSGVNCVEREGISYIHPSEFLLVGSMNPEEAPLRAEFLDRFGLYVEMKGIHDPDQRKRIVRQRMDYERDPIAFAARYDESEHTLVKRIVDAKNRMKHITVGEDMIAYAADLALTAHAAGHRADIVMTETALAIAALVARNGVQKEDIEKAAKYVLPHRIREIHQPMAETLQRQSLPNDQMKSQKPHEGAEKGAFSGAQPQMQPNSMGQDGNAQTGTAHHADTADDPIVSGNDVYAVVDIGAAPRDRNRRKGSGRRSKTVSGTRKGRYIGYSQPRDASLDIALNATLRVAAVHQKQRKKTDTAIRIHTSDIRVKRREHRAGATIVFAVDASGSMGARRRMIATKDAILSLLFDAYQKRDRVGMIAFRGQTAQVVLPITRSIDLAQNRLQKLPTGGRTPLAQGLLLARQMIHTKKNKDEDTIPLLILITDGRANDTQCDDPVGEAMTAAQAIARDGIQSVVIDTEKELVPLGIAAQVAERMNAQYLKMDELKAEAVADVVRKASLL